MNGENEGTGVPPAAMDPAREPANPQELVRTATFLVDLMMSLGRLERVASAH